MIGAMELWKWAAMAVVVFLVSVFSGIAGGGGGFVTAPLFILLGMTPAQAVSTLKLSGLAIAIGTLGGMREAHGRVSRRRVIPVMVLALLVGLAVPFLIKSLDSTVYRVVMGAILLLMIPVVLVKKVGLQEFRPTAGQKFAGGVLLTMALFLQGVFGGGMSAAVNLVLMGMLGMTATEANITKRWSQLILTVTVVLGVLTSGLIVWTVAAVAVPLQFVGGYLGGRMAVKRGDRFIMNVMVALMAISALALIFGVRGG